MVGLWPNRTPEARAEEGAPDHSSIDISESHDDDAQQRDSAPRDRPRVIATFFCGILAVAWVAFLVVTRIPAWLQSPPTSEQLALFIAVGCAPLAVIGIAYSLIARGSKAETTRFLKISAGLRTENEQLEATLSRVSAELTRQRAILEDTGEQLVLLGEDATHRVRDLGSAMSSDVDLIVRHTQALRQSASIARADVSVLLTDLPKGPGRNPWFDRHARTRRLAAHEQVGQLDAQLSALTVRGREADEIAGNAAQKLAAHLGRIEGVSATAGTRLTEAATTMTEAVDVALDHAARAGDAARQSMEAQGAAMVALVDQAQAALARTGADSARAVTLQIEDASERVEAMGALLAGQSEATAHLMAGLRNGLDSLDESFAALDEKGDGTQRAIGSGAVILVRSCGTLTGALDRGTETADALIGRTEMLMTALDATSREIDETLPAAFDRLDRRALASKEVVARTSPEVEALERNASSALDRLMEAEALLAKQRVLLDEFATHAEARLTETGNTTRSLVEEIGKPMARRATWQMVRAANSSKRWFACVKPHWPPPTARATPSAA